MKKEGFSDIFNSRDGKINSRLFSLLLIIVTVLLSLAIFVSSSTSSRIFFYSGDTVANESVRYVANFSAQSIQVNCTATIENSIATNANITNMTLNITFMDLATTAVFNQTNNTIDQNYNNTVIQFNMTLGEGEYMANCSAYNRTTLLNSTRNLTIRIDLTSPTITNKTTASNISFINGATRNQTESALTLSITAYDLITGVRNVTLLRNGTLVNSTSISQNLTTNVSYVLAGSDINSVFNFTLNVSDFVGRSSVTDGLLVTVDKDGTPPGPITLNSPITKFNQTSTTAPVFNFTAFDNNDTSLKCVINISLGGASFNLSTGGSQLTQLQDLNITNGTAHVNTTTIVLSNGTYTWNVSCTDSPSNFNVSLSRTFTVDQIPPVFDYYNFTDTVNINATPGDAVAAQLNKSAGRSSAQGRTIYGVSNWTDNLTQPFMGILQFHNETSGAWTTINTSSTVAPSNGSWINLSYDIQKGHSEFEGRNVSFRIIANDTLGNVNTTNVKNFTIQINDTTVPTITINGTISVNNTNTTDTRPIISWSINELNRLASINVSVDGTVAAGNGVESGCNKYAFFTTSGDDNNVETGDGGRGFRNFSFQIKNTASCTLANGTHNINITAIDTWGNSIKFIHDFTIQSGSVPVIVIENISSSFFEAVNMTNVTSLTDINFSATAGATGTIKNMSFTSSCNSTGGTFANNTAIRPFQGTTCEGASANRTITVTASDFSGNTVSTTFQFLVDNTGLSLAVQLPTPGSSVANNVPLNVTAVDDSLALSFVGYYLDDSGATQLNFTATGITPAAGNLSFNRSINFTPGTHRIKFTVNDTLGNVVNSSVIIFTVTGPVNFGYVNSSINSYIASVFNTNLTNVSIRIKTGTGYEQVNTTNESSTNTFEILYNMNNTINISLTDINGSAANWDKINFTPFINDTTFVPNLQTNWTASVLSSVWFNNSLEEFITNNNSYYGVVVFPYNISGTTATAQEFWWIENEGVLANRTNISQCTSAFTSLTTIPCWNYTVAGKTIVQVPHFSGVDVVNDTRPPTVGINMPIGLQDTSSFFANITVSNDASLCNFTLAGASRANATYSMAGPAVFAGAKICTFHLNITNGTAENNNITFYVFDASNNLNTTALNFNVSDLTIHTASISNSGGSTTGTIVSLAANESVNMSLTHGAALNNACGAQGTTATPENDFSTSQSITITLSTVSSAAVICYNVTSCDKAGNCLTNGTFNFTQTATAAAAAASTSSSSGGASGGGGGTPSNEAASTSQRWDSLGAGSSAVLTINNENIAVTGVIVDIKNAVTNGEVKVASLVSNPQSTTPAAKVYQYLQLTKSNIADSDASKITINFKVPKSWLLSNSVSEDDIILYRYNDGKWDILPTTKIGSDANNILYQSTTPGFSTFAIGTKEAPPAVIPPEAVPETQPPAQPETPPVTPETPPAQPEVMEKEGASRTAMAWIVVVIIVVVAGVGYYMWQKKKGEY